MLENLFVHFKFSPSHFNLLILMLTIYTLTDSLKKYTKIPAFRSVPRVPRLPALSKLRKRKKYILFYYSVNRIKRKIFWFYVIISMHCNKIGTNSWVSSSVKFSLTSPLVEGYSLNLVSVICWNQGLWYLRSVSQCRIGKSSAGSDLGVRK